MRLPRRRGARTRGRARSTRPAASPAATASRPRRCGAGLGRHAHDPGGREGLPLRRPVARHRGSPDGSAPRRAAGMAAAGDDPVRPRPPRAAPRRDIAGRTPAAPVRGEVFGRAARGETHERRRCSRIAGASAAAAGWSTPTRCASTAPIGDLARPAGRGGRRRALGDPPPRRARCRARLDEARAPLDGSRARLRGRASAWNGLLAVRFCATHRPGAAREAAAFLTGFRRRRCPRLASVKVDAMNLTPREKDKLLVAMAAMVARNRLERGVKLNHPEAMALITDFVVEGARDGRTRRRADGGGRACAHRRPGDAGHRRDDPRHPGRGDVPGRHQARHRASSDPRRGLRGRARRGDRRARARSSSTRAPSGSRSRVANTGDRPIQVGSHYHFFETNPALRFDRDKARGMRLDIAPGTAVRFEPGSTREVMLVPSAASARSTGSART